MEGRIVMEGGMVMVMSLKGDGHGGEWRGRRWHGWRRGRWGAPCVEAGGEMAWGSSIDNRETVPGSD